MGGATGRTKNAIIHAMIEAKSSDHTIRVKELADLCGVSMPTISGHLRDLADKFGYVHEDPQLRGLWELTTAGMERAKDLLTVADRKTLPLGQIEGVPFPGSIAAGPAIRIEQSTDVLVLPQFDSAHHFALRVQGKSMVSFGILTNDIIVFRKVNSWMDVPDGKIVAARVPEGTGADVEDWLDQIDRTISAVDDANIPPLDHVTLKKFDARFKAYVHKGMELRRAAPQLRGSTGRLGPIAVAIDGYKVYLLRED